MSNLQIQYRACSEDLQTQILGHVSKSKIVEVMIEPEIKTLVESQDPAAKQEALNGLVAFFTGALRGQNKLGSQQPLKTVSDTQIRGIIQQHHKI